MHIFSVHPHMPDIDRPTCAECGTLMWLARVEPDKPGYDKRTFECPVCDRSVVEIVKYLGK